MTSHCARNAAAASAACGSISRAFRQKWPLLLLAAAAATAPTRRLSQQGGKFGASHF